MPTINDATVVASAYDTSGNGGRKLVRLSNGWLVSVLNSGTYATGLFLRVYKPEEASPSWQPLCTITNAGYDVALTSVGTKVYVVYFSGGVKMNVIEATTQTNVDVASSQTVVDSVTINTTGRLTIINDGSSYLHVSHNSITPTYASSHNIRYAKGTINADGSVTWGAVEQRTTVNTAGTDYTNPSITLNKNGYPVIAVTRNTWVFSHVYNGSSWTEYTIYNGASYAQSSPSAIFVPQSINGLANGRIHNFWHGTDATDTTALNIRYSYSDDGGVTWSAMQKLTSGNTYAHGYPSPTANKSNQIFVYWHGKDATSGGNNNIKRISNLSGTWGAIETITTNTTNHALYPSTLFDLSVNFTSPLFIYQNNQTAKVGFYGTWTVTTISVTQGSIGTKTDKSNLLTYSITTDGSMSTITEKVNGTIIGTKSATSGQSLIAGLTQAQWDAIKFGKYADATGGLNTLTVEMGSEKWTYTFDKRLATSDDVLSAVKAVQDTNNVYLPSVKAKLVAKVGGLTSDTFETLINGIVIPKKASGTATSSSATSSFTTGSGGAQSAYVLTVTGLTFTPSKITIRATNEDYHVVYDKNFPTVPISRTQSRLSSPVAITFKLTGPAFVNSTSFAMPALSASTSYEWDAQE